jgi:hypothetical protein
VEREGGAGFRVRSGGRSFRLRAATAAEADDWAAVLGLGAAAMAERLPVTVNRFERAKGDAFDERGVLFHLGTKGGTQPYANPHGGDSGVVASMSSVDSNFGDPKKLTEHRHCSEFYKFTEDKPGQWAAVDLGASHRLVLDHYALRHDKAGYGYLRSWTLEGSNDADTWQPLREHKNDASLAAKMAVAAWALDGAAVGGCSFRHFRVRQTGENAGGIDNLCCAGIELYGRLTTRELSKEEEEEQAAAAVAIQEEEEARAQDDY